MQQSTVGASGWEGGVTNEGCGLSFRGGGDVLTLTVLMVAQLCTD